MLRILFFILFVLTISATAQRENHTWYFSGSSKGFFFDFNTNAVSITSTHAPLSYEGCGVAADPTTGDVLFYSNGINIYDKNNIQMPNGSGLLGNITCSTNGIICPFPGQPNKYFLFYNSANIIVSDVGYLYYSIVDMSLVGNGTVSNPLGDIVSSQKNILVTSNTPEGFSVIRGNLNNFWLVYPERNSSIIKVFEITSSGVTLHATFNAGVNIDGAMSVRYAKTTHKIAIANAYEYEGCFIMDFDENTGNVSNINLIPGSILGSAINYWTGYYDCEWSSDGTKLYLSKGRMATGSGRIYQYDLNFPTNPISLIYTLAGGYSNTSSGLKLAPDGKIYSLYLNSIYSDSRFIGAITLPNNAGTSCGFVPNVLDMGSSFPSTGKFPEFLAPYICNNISVNDANICSGQSATLTVTGATSYSWNNGLDTNSQQIVSPTSTTLYIVTGTTGTCVSADTAIVTVNPNPTPSITGNLLLCVSGFTTLDAGSGYVFYNWSQGGHTQSINVTSIGTYTVTVTNANGCKGTGNAIVTSVTDNLQVTLSSNNPICTGQTLNLTSLPSGGTSYSWTGPNSFTSSVQNPTITSTTIAATGTYSVTVTLAGGCTGTGQISVIVNPSPVLILNNDTSITLGDSIHLEVNGASSYLWSPTEDLSCTTCNNPIAAPNNSISYCVVGINANGCSDTACVNIAVNNECGNIWVPSAFSPNGDGENDVLYVCGKCIKSIEFRIFNRWGEKVFASNDPTVGWDGLFRGKALNTDVFVYYLKAENYNGSKVELKGNITLMR